MHNEELEEAAKREKLLNILNLVDVYIPPTPSNGEQDDQPDDDSAFAADVQKAGNLTSAWLREMEALSKTNPLRQKFMFRGQIGEPG